MADGFTASAAKMLFRPVNGAAWNTSVDVQCAPLSVDRDRKMLLKFVLVAFVRGSSRCMQVVERAPVPRPATIGPRSLLNAASPVAAPYRPAAREFCGLYVTSSRRL